MSHTPPRSNTAFQNPPWELEVNLYALYSPIHDCCAFWNILRCLLEKPLQPQLQLFKCVHRNKGMKACNERECKEIIIYCHIFLLLFNEHCAALFGMYALDTCGLYKTDRDARKRVSLTQLAAVLSVIFSKEERIRYITREHCNIIQL